MEGSCDAVPALDDSQAPPERRNALICVLILIFCVFVVHPAAHEGYLDDFSYAATSLEFLRTGHVVYNSWSAPTEGWMIAWGALFIKLFGFSFFTLRMANLPFALGVVYLFHRILARFGVSQRNASVGALVLGLSPVFFPVGLSFMTDVPGLFVILLCVSMCQRATSVSTSKATILWLVLAAIVNVAGGTVRQNAWLGALVIVPSTGWMLRRRRGVLLASVISAISSLGLILALVHWFYGRPNMFVDPATQRVPHFSARDLGRELAKLFLCLLFLMLPLLAAWWGTFRRVAIWAVVRISAGVGIVAICLYDAARRHRLYIWLAPWLHSAISRYTGYANDVDQLFGSSFKFPDWLGVALALLTTAAAMVAAEQVFAGKMNQQPAAESKLAVRSFLWILGPFTLVSVLLLLPRAQMYGLYDRYVLSLMPFAIALLLLAYQGMIGADVPLVSFVVLAILACYSVADAHDYYADMRAGDTAIQELTAAGIPETSISQSENRDAWLQVYLAGRINWSGTAGAGDGATASALHRPGVVPCSTYIGPETPVIHPEYFVVFSPSSCLQPSPYPPVRYRAWLPPFHRSESIEQPKYRPQ